MTYTDLRISVRAAWSRQHMLNGATHVENVPAWVCHVARNEGYDVIVNEQELTFEQVTQLSRLLDDMLGTNDVTAAAEAAQHKLRQELERQLAYAQSQANRVPRLQAALQKGTQP